jgi:hypothetical protein
MTDLKHVGVMGMHWGQRKGSSSSSKGNTRRFQIQSLTKNMDGRKTNKLFGKRNRKGAGKAIVDFLMTPTYSKTKWSDMDENEKKKVLKLTGVAVAAIGVMTLSGL